MVFDFDLRLFCENLKATKPPYECPAPGCGRVYKTYIGIQFHLFNYDHENPDGKNASTPDKSGQQKQQDALKKSHHRQLHCPSSPGRVNHDESEHEVSSSSLSPHNASTKSHRVVEVNLDGRVHRINIYEPMNVVVHQPQAAASESLDNKPLELVEDSTVSVQTSDERPPGASVTTDTAISPADACCNPTVTNDSSETVSKDCAIDTPAENVAAVESDLQKTETICDADSCNDTKPMDMKEATVSADQVVSGSLPSVEHLHSDICTVTDRSLSTPCVFAVDSAAGPDVKTEVADAESIEPREECGDKNIPCSNASITSTSPALLNGSTVTTSFVQSTESDVLKTCNTKPTVTSNVLQSAPTKLSVLPSAEFKVRSDYVRPPKMVVAAQKSGYYKFTERTAEELDAVVEYDMDEEV